MENKMLYCDFHVHTIFSKCYSKDSDITPEENINHIIDKCYEKNINLIAFTDHNSISAYILYKQIKEELEQAVKYAEVYQIEKEKYADKLALLQKYRFVNVLPGVEFDLKPGIHLISIFNPNTPVEEIVKLIESNGYSIEDGFGEGSPKYEVLDFLEYLSKYDTITIAPHVDNDKGIYSSLNGDYRGSIFKSKQLTAISCQNSKVQTTIVDLITNDKHYKRDYPLAFVYCSDAHNIKDIGSSLTYVKAENNFYDIKKAFETPENYILSTPNNTLTERIKNIIESKRFSTIINQEDLTSSFKKHYIGHYNNGYGTILIGVLSNSNIIGLSTTKEFIEDTIKKQIEEIKTSIDYIEPVKIYIEKVNGEKYVAIVTILNKFHSICFDSETEDSYIIVNNNCKKASIIDIINLANRQVIDFYEHDNISRIKNLVNFISEYQQIIDISTSYSVKKKIEKSFLQFSDLFIFDVMEINSSIPNCSGNGIDNGNIVYLSSNKIRLDDTMTRCTAPSFNVEENALCKASIVGNGIVIVDGGASYILNNNSHKLIVNNEALFLRLKDEYADTISLHSVLAWLKSTAFLWYVLINCGNDNLFSPKVFSKIIIPTKIAKNKKDIHNCISEIIAKEESFLQNVNKEEDTEIISSLIKKHNLEVNIIAQQFDDLIYKFINFTAKEIDYIEGFIKSKKHCLYKIQSVKKS